MSLFAAGQRQRQTADEVRRIEDCLSRATRTLGDHDRLGHRRGHRDEIAQARRELQTLPQRLTELTEGHRRLTTQTQEAQAVRDDAADRTARHQRAAAEIAAALDEDADARGRQAALQPPAWLVEQLGPVPADAGTRQRWIMAAGCSAQHQAVAHDRDHQDRSPTPSLEETEAEKYTQDEARRARAELHEFFQRRTAPELEGPGLSL